MKDIQPARAGGKKPLIVLTGPTAVGKTALSISLAKAVNGEIISADSMQVYRHMDIGTAKITSEEMAGVPHYLIDCLEPEEEFNVTVFQKYAKQYISEIHSRGNIPIIVGGTGFYIQSVLKDVSFEENETDKTYRRELEEVARTQGADVLHHQLSLVDAASAKAIHPNNVKRVIRALEYYRQTGNPISVHNATESEKTSPYNFVYFVLTLPREILYERIDKRVDVMMEQGLFEEVQSLQAAGYDRNLVSMQGLGYKEFWPCLDGKITLDQAVNAVKQGTRHFAKRQGTWFRRERDVIQIRKDEFADEGEILAHMVKICKEKEIFSNY